MRPKLIAILVANLLAVSPLAFAEEGDLQWSGSVTVGARYVDDKVDDPSKLNEYRDLGSGGTGIAGFELRGRGEQYYTNIYGENLGHDDQYLDVRGGSYGVFKYRLYSDELRHNFGSGPGARSPFTGIGSGTLTMTRPRPAVASWGTFDHSYSRRDLGAMAEWQANTPWYFRVETNEVKREGINVFAGAKGTSPGNGFMDLPSPIDYTTQNVSGELGYSTKRGHFAVSVLHSKFENGNDLLRWTNEYMNPFPAGGIYDTTILPPDNSLTRLAFNGNLRQLPWNSTLAGRFTYSQLKNDVTMQQTMLDVLRAPVTFNSITATNPNSPAFHGDIKKTTLSLSFTSHPVGDLDTKAYLNYAKDKNDSTQMSFSPPADSGLVAGSTDPLVNCNRTATNPCEPEKWRYKKTNIGVEAGYRLSRENKLSGGLDYADMERERADFQKSKDTKFFAQWRNTSIDWLTGRIKYQYLSRHSDFEPHPAVLAANPVDLYVRRFDLANVNQNLLKLVLDATPAPRVDLGFEAIFKNNDYKDTILGRTNDTRQEYYASASFGDPNELRLLVFGDVELAEFESFHRQLTTGNANPATMPDANNFNWTAKNQDRSWQVGLGVDWRSSARLTFKGSLIFAKTEGTADFSAEPGGGGPFQPITNFDNTKRTSVNLKAIYAYDKRWDFTGGYSYEKYSYDDIGYTGTLYVTSATNTAGVVTGQFSFQPYTANILYATAKYKF